MSVRIELGYYANLFEVLVPAQEIQVMVCKRANYPSLRELREGIKKSRKEIFVYAPEGSDIIYGYGNGMEWLFDKDFNLETINFYDKPKLTSRMIIEGVIKKARQIGLSPRKTKQDKDICQILDENKGRWKFYNPEKAKITSDNQVRVFIGYDLRVIFLRDPLEDRLNFGLIVDITYFLRDMNDNPLNYRAITSRFDRNTLREVRQIQKDFIPTGINREVSRQRLIEDIIPFVEQLGEIELPCGLKVKVVSNPCRIILGDEDEAVW